VVCWNSLKISVRKREPDRRFSIQRSTRIETLQELKKESLWVWYRLTLIIAWLNEGDTITLSPTSNSITKTLSCHGLSLTRTGEWYKLPCCSVEGVFQFENAPFFWWLKPFIHTNRSMEDSKCFRWRLKCGLVETNRRTSTFVHVQAVSDWRNRSVFSCLWRGETSSKTICGCKLFALFSASQ